MQMYCNMQYFSYLCIVIRKQQVLTQTSNIINNLKNTIMKKFRSAKEIISDINRCSALIELSRDSYNRTNILYSILHRLSIELENIMSPF